MVVYVVLVSLSTRIARTQLTVFENS